MEGSGRGLNQVLSMSEENHNAGLWVESRAKDVSNMKQEC
jgi:hypothetical protein